MSAYSQTLEEGEQVVRWSKPCWGPAGWIGVSKGAFFQPHVGVEVDLCRLHRFVAKPQCNHPITVGSTFRRSRSIAAVCRNECGVIERPRSEEHVSPAAAT